VRKLVEWREWCTKERVKAPHHDCGEKHTKWPEHGLRGRDQGGMVVSHKRRGGGKVWVQKARPDKTKGVDGSPFGYGIKTRRNKKNGGRTTNQDNREKGESVRTKDLFFRRGKQDLVRNGQNVHHDCHLSHGGGGKSI